MLIDFRAAANSAQNTKSERGEISSSSGGDSGEDNAIVAKYNVRRALIELIDHN